MFEKATRQKYRFKTDVGLVTVEDLWDLPLTGLDKLAKALRKELQEAQEESFLETKPRSSVIETKFEIVKYIIQVKLKEKEDAVNVKAKKERKEKILEILAEKQNEALSQKTPEELLKELEELGV
jgi:hypothetical protein